MQSRGDGLETLRALLESTDAVAADAAPVLELFAQIHCCVGGELEARVHRVTPRRSKVLKVVLRVA